MIILVIIGLYCAICLIGGIAQYIKTPRPPNGLTWSEYNEYYKNKAWLSCDEDDLEDIHANERIMLLDETIIKYEKLLDNLKAQYNGTYNETEKAKILAKQITTMEKLNRALEKREKLE
jgi:hypothetical protein